DGPSRTARRTPAPRATEKPTAAARRCRRRGASSAGGRGGDAWALLNFPQGGDAHRLVVKLAARVTRCRSQFTIRIESRKHHLRAENMTHVLHLLLRALPKHDLTADAADAERQFRSAVRQGRLLRGAAGAVDQVFVGGAEKPHLRTLRHVSRETHALRGFVDAEATAHHGLAGGAWRDAERKAQGRRWQRRRLLAEVVLVESERGLAVEFEQRVAPRPGDDALRAEGHPAAARADADAEVAPMQPQRHDAAGLGRRVEADQRFRKM